MSNRILLLVIITLVLCSTLGAFAATVKTASLNNSKAVSPDVERALRKSRQMSMMSFEHLKADKLTMTEKAIFKSAQKQLAGKYARLNATLIAEKTEREIGQMARGWKLGCVAITLCSFISVCTFDLFG